MSAGDRIPFVIPVVWSVEKGEVVDEEESQREPEIVVEEAQTPERQPLLANFS